MDTRHARLAALAAASLLIFAACDSNGDDATAEPQPADDAPVATPATDDEGSSAETEDES